MLYTKAIDGRQVFSDCHTILMNDGTWVSNPSAEQITAAGWMEWTPPEEEETYSYEPPKDDIIDAIRKMLSTAAAELTDEEALAVAAIYPTWVSKINQPVAANERLWFNDNLYRVIQPHTVQDDWTPDITPALYVLVSLEEWPDWIQPMGSEDAYEKGARVSHNEKHWESEYDNNVWEPGVYGWIEK